MLKAYILNVFFIQLVVKLGSREEKTVEICRILRDVSGNGYVSYPCLRGLFMKRLGLVSRYAFDNWVIYCISEDWLKPVDGSIRQTGNTVVYEVNGLAVRSLFENSESKGLPVVLSSADSVGFEQMVKALDARRERLTVPERRIPWVIRSCKQRNWGKSNLQNV